MALILVSDCPHCGIENTGLTFVAESQCPNGYRWNTMFRCNNCNKPITANVEINGGNKPSSFHGDLTKIYEIKIRGIYPTSKPSSAPDHCPENIAKAFIQAEENIFRRNAEAAASMDRRALEIGTKLIAPDLVNETLWNRIERLAERHLITPSIQEWAHSLRLIGNDALHDIDGVTLEEAKQAHELTRFMLIYLFTLPEQVRLSKEANAPKSTE